MTGKKVLFSSKSFLKNTVSSTIAIPTFTETSLTVAVTPMGALLNIGLTIELICKQRGCS